MHLNIRVASLKNRRNTIFSNSSQSVKNENHNYLKKKESNSKVSKKFSDLSLNGESIYFNDESLKLEKIIPKEEIKNIILQKKLTIKENDLECYNSFKYKILVVDDNKFLRQSFINLIKKFLKNRNMTFFYDIIDCNDGVDILYHIVKDQSENNLIKCIITDENMDYMNGSEACRIIKNYENNNKIKPVVLAMISSFETNYFDKNFGINYFLPKPCNEHQLSIFFDEFKLFHGQDYI
jgi:CheY-like chemotaxis protein